MKKFISILSGLVLTFAFVTSVLAVKPVDKLEGAIDVPWNLSGDVMPLPWGLQDITGSDTSSKLVVNQPNGNSVEIAVTGIMNGLSPNTLYQVFTSNPWSNCDKWNVVGNDWELTFMYSGNSYNHHMNVTEQNMYTGYFVGDGFSNTDTNVWTILNTSRVVGDEIYLDLVYTSNTSYKVYAKANIADGKIVGGTWTSSSNQTGTWYSTAGTAETEEVGCGYPGLFWNQEIFTFVTDENGHASWHFNLTDEDFPRTGETFEMSIWVNKPGATILISDNFSVEVE